MFGLKVGKSDFYRQISTSNSLIWFHLYDYGTGKPYKGTTATKVSVPIGSDISDFRKAVKAEYSDSHLKGISPSDLLVFKNKHSFDKRNSNEEKVIYLNLTNRKCCLRKIHLWIVLESLKRIL
jgi:hypothetical protein